VQQTFLIDEIEDDILHYKFLLQVTLSFNVDFSPLITMSGKLSIVCFKASNGIFSSYVYE